MRSSIAHLVFLLASTGNNKTLAENVGVRAQELGHDVDILSLNDYEFPLYSTKMEEKTDALPGLDNLIDRLAQADAWMVFAPEYNGSYPPVLNNAIAWLSRQGDDFRQLFRDRTVALATHSGGGGSHVIMAMRMQFSFLGCNVIGRSLMTNNKKPANPDTVAALINSMTQM
jgi:NAD(P)H-dependent FMN reductase